MKKFLIFGVLLLAIVIVLGCSGKPTYSTDNTSSGESQTQQQTAQQPAVTTVQTLEMFFASGESWDADPDVDGIEVTIEPKDRDDSLIETAGTVTAKLWESDYDYKTSEQTKGNLIQEWTVSITKDSYDFSGANLRLEYKAGVTPKSSDIGWLEVTLTTPDGQSFTARDDYVLIAGI